jgi:2-polyprenyl-6-methoxyphenol hydroxylase-like FAD-dependent oxidoreductase
MPHLGKHAIVIGASMGGLLAARALSDYYDDVTVLERDVLPKVNEPRKGVPLGRHAHGLLARGREILEEWFPGFTEETIAQGAIPGDLVDKGLWFSRGVYLSNVPSKLSGLGISRPMLENEVRGRLLQIPNVRVCEQSNALEPMFLRESSRVSGVRVQDKVTSNTEAIDADLIIDASGRGLSSSGWLSKFGYDEAPEEQIKVNVNYVSRLYRRLPEHLEQGLRAGRANLIGALVLFWVKKAIVGS